MTLDYHALFERIIQDQRYLANLDYGEPRPGHPEGTVRAHIADIEQNLERLKPRLSDEDYWKAKILVHTHDSFKAKAAQDVPIIHPQSHASLAAAFVKEFVDETDFVAIVQYHDEPYALYRQFLAKGTLNDERLQNLLSVIKDWNLFLAFTIINGCTDGKDREPLIWLFQTVEGRVTSIFTESDIIQ